MPVSQSGSVHNIPHYGVVTSVALNNLQNSSKEVPPMHASNYRLYNEPVSVSVCMQTVAGSECMIYSVTRVFMCLKCNEQCCIYSVYYIRIQLDDSCYEREWGEGRRELPISSQKLCNMVLYSLNKHLADWEYKCLYKLWLTSICKFVAVGTNSAAVGRLLLSNRTYMTKGVKDDVNIVIWATYVFYVTCWLNSYRIR